MAVFTGLQMADNAVKAAFEIHYATGNIVNPSFETVYPQSARKLQFTIGIDEGECLAVKVGVRDAGEIAWIGAAANYAAKLNSFTGLDHGYPIRITTEVFNRLSPVHLTTGQGTPVWEGPYNNFPAHNHYRSRCWREIP
jgi:class 3 adenylate cyclase